MSIKRKGIVFVVSGPSGVGKSSICDRVLNADDVLHFSISCTTRPPRPGEKDGVNYFFISPVLFEERVTNRDFIEHAEVHGNMYGTLRSEIDDTISAGKDVLLEIDIQGTMQIQAAARGSDLATSLHCVFIGPPSSAELEKRLRGRGTESDEIVERRLNQARTELDHWREYDSLIVNDDLDSAVSRLQTIIASERLAIPRMKDNTPW
jgi:guanylate kinase